MSYDLNKLSCLLSGKSGSVESDINDFLEKKLLFTWLIFVKLSDYWISR